MYINKTKRIVIYMHQKMNIIEIFTFFFTSQDKRGLI